MEKNKKRILYSTLISYLMCFYNYIVFLPLQIASSSLINSLSSPSFSSFLTHLPLLPPTTTHLRPQLHPTPGGREGGGWGGGGDGIGDIRKG